MNQTIRDIESSFLKEKDSLPELNVGDTVKVFVKIKEGGKERTQGYEGVIIKRRGSGVNASITVRRVFRESLPAALSPGRKHQGSKTWIGQTLQALLSAQQNR